MADDADRLQWLEDRVKGLEGQIAESTAHDADRLQLEGRVKSSPMVDNISEKELRTIKNPAILKDSVFLAAFIAAIIAALANAYVAYINNNTLFDVENHKEAEEQLIEAKKAEFMGLLEISKLDVGSAQQKIKGFCEISLITDPSICGANALSAQGSSASSRPTRSTENFATATWDSPWVGGGHSQQEICNQGLSELKDRYNGKVILTQTSSEDSRRDLFGHVEYRYHCTYRVSDSGGR